MPINKTEVERHRAVQDKPSYRRLCSICVREYYDSLVSACPERDGRQVCMYCCRMCEESYTLPGQIGQRCRAKDRARAEGRKDPHQSPAATASPRGSQGGRIAAGAGRPRNDGKEETA